jgi:DNA-directed RNA polymerase subunit RPC12/RpoP
MTDIFDAQIICKKCNSEMQPTNVLKEGFVLRAVQCPQCNDRILHPADVPAVNQFHELRGKTFTVKLRMVGNSHAISIPKEIVDFMQEQQRHANKQMADMVRLCFEDAHRLSVMFDGFDEFSRQQQRAFT